MPFDMTLPVIALSGAALTALCYRFWPRIAVRTHREKHRGIGVREIAVSVSRPAFARAARADWPEPARFEFVIYFTLKSCNP
jgi:hypothetical protein